MDTTIKTTIKDWLFDCTGNIESVNPSKVFKHYKPLDRGNSKLCNGILSFSLLPIVTCGGKACKGCYDLRSQRYNAVRKKRYVNTSMAMHNSYDLFNLIVKQIVQSKSCKYVRIHVGGDFFSKEYVNFWIMVVKKINRIKPDIKFYTYTKGSHTASLKKAGINVVKSVYPEGYNFGSIEYVQDMAKKYKGFICPATLGKVPNKFCGNKCKACINMEAVFFKLH